MSLRTYVYHFKRVISKASTCCSVVDGRRRSVRSAPAKELSEGDRGLPQKRRFTPQLQRLKELGGFGTKQILHGFISKMRNVFTHERTWVLLKRHRYSGEESRLTYSVLRIASLSTPLALVPAFLNTKNFLFSHLILLNFY